MQSSSTLKIDIGAIEENIHLFSAATGGQLMLMMKANAYGSDPLILAKTVHKEIAFIGVSHVKEAISLREAGSTLPLFVLSVPPYEAEYAALYQLTAAVSTEEEIEALDAAGKKYECRLPLHLHLDTGMNRFGASNQEAQRLLRAIQRATHVYLEGVMTHFAASDSLDHDEFTLEQIFLFKNFINSLPFTPRWIHAANSAGATRFSLPFCNLTRIGLGMMGYGFCPQGSRPAFSLSTRLCSISLRKKGETVSYNRTYTIVKERERIGVIPLGYHDGLCRHLSGKGYVLIHQKKAPMIGLICMDFMMIDLTLIPEAEVGDEVILFGTALSPEVVSQWGGLDVRELLSKIPSRVERNWIHAAHYSLR